MQLRRSKIQIKGCHSHLEEEGEEKEEIQKIFKKAEQLHDKVF